MVVLITPVRPPKLSPEQIAEILTKLAGGATPLALGKEYGVSDQTIYRHARLAKDRAWDIESAGQVNDGGDNVVPIRPAPLLTLPALAKAQEERYQRAVESGVDPLTGALTTPAESDGKICHNVTRELYKALRASVREDDRRGIVDISKAIAAVVRARHQIAPPKAARGPLKTYTVEASPESWPEPPKKDDDDGRAEAIRSPGHAST